ncbi:MAG: helix-turn-helix transcriptional regulator [Sphingomonadales bacterium]
MARIQTNVVERIAAFGGLPDSALLSINEISALASRSNASIWRDVKAGRLPKPLKIGAGSSRWLVGDVRRYLNGEVG